MALKECILDHAPFSGVSTELKELQNSNVITCIITDRKTKHKHAQHSAEHQRESMILSGNKLVM